MVAFTLRRLIILLPMLVVVTFLVYLGLELTPGDAVSFLLDPEKIGELSQAQLDAMRETLGLNDPFLVRYIRWLSGIIVGKFGYSPSSGVPIKDIVFDRLPATLELSFVAIILSTVVGSVLGLVSALRKGTIADHTMTVIGMVGVSVPQFFFALLAILFFALRLRWFPVGGRLQPGYETLWDRLPHLVLPALVLSAALTAGVMRFARSSMLDSMNKKYVATARSKGLPEWRVNLVHGFRVAMTPVVVLVGFRLPVLIGGSVIIEQVFTWPGMGIEFVKAVRGQNYPLVMMIALFYVVVVLIASFLVDLLTAIIDPRIKME